MRGQRPGDAPPRRAPPAPAYLQYEAQSRQERGWDVRASASSAQWDRPDSPGRREREWPSARVRQQTVDNRLPGLPRYARVNTLLTTLGTVRRSLADSGHVLLDWTSEAAISGGGGGRACRRDEHVPDLLVFKPKGQSDISRVPMVARGELIVQQKASCFPALALAPPPGSHVIDGCAAPGNKTTHLAALMENEGSILAYEQDARRCALLEQASPHLPAPRARLGRATPGPCPETCPLHPSTESSCRRPQLSPECPTECSLRVPVWAADATGARRHMRRGGARKLSGRGPALPLVCARVAHLA